MHCRDAQPTENPWSTDCYQLFQYRDKQIIYGRISTDFRPQYLRAIQICYHVALCLVEPLSYRLALWPILGNIRISLNMFHNDLGSS